MAIEKITMPQLGESVTEGVISNWLVKVGDKVNKYDPIAEVLTDKVNAEIPSSFTGYIKEIIAKEGESISVDEVICTIETEQEHHFNQSSAIEESPNNSEISMKKRYSPAVLRLAQENNIDLKEVTGTGRGGRITRKDIEKIIASNSNQTTSISNNVKAKQTSNPSPLEKQIHLLNDKEIPVKGIRKVIADNMVKANSEIPHAWMTVEVDVTELVMYRNRIKHEFFNNEGFPLTYFSFFVKAVASALKEFPQLNSTWNEDKIIQRRDINLSIAVANEDILYVPVIKHADEKTIKGIAREINQFAYKARTNSLTNEDMEGGTFTVNNTGTFGSIHSMGIINHPQAAILQVESIVKRPVIINDMFAARDMVNLCLSIDHRILDGLISGRFLTKVKEILENMNEETLNIY